MAPDLFTTTTTTTCSNWDITPTDTGTSNYAWTNAAGDDSYTISIVSKPTEHEIKKQLKKMMDKLCMDGWVHHMVIYHQPKLPDISLRGTRLDGRGWANK